MKINTMKLITFIFTLFLFISCEDDKAEEKAKEEEKVEQVDCTPLSVAFNAAGENYIDALIAGTLTKAICNDYVTKGYALADCYESLSYDVIALRAAIADVATSVCDAL
jgi:hypothetical protein